VIDQMRGRVTVSDLGAQIVGLKFEWSNIVFL